MSKTAIEISKKNLFFGIGPGGFKTLYPEYQIKFLDETHNFIATSYVHNDYIQILTEFGILGLILFLSFVFYIFYLFDKTTIYFSKKTFLFSLALLTSIFSILIESFFNFPLFIFPSSFLFFLYLGIISSFLTGKNKNITLNKNFSKLFITILIFILSISLFSKLNPFLSNFFLKYALILDTKNNPKKTYYFKKAVKLNPYDFYTHYYLGSSYASLLKMDLAIEEYKKALKIYPNSADILYDIATIYFVKKDFKNAISFLKKTLKYYPDFGEAHLLLGKIYIYLNKDSLADKHLSIVARKAPYLLQKDISKNLIIFKEITLDK